MSEFPIILGAIGIYWLSTKIKAPTKRPCVGCGPSVGSNINPAAQYGPNGTIIQDNYIRDDFQKDRSKFGDYWSPEDLKNQFGVLLGDEEAMYGPNGNTQVSDRSPQAQYLSPFTNRDPGAVSSQQKKFNTIV